MLSKLYAVERRILSTFSISYRRYLFDCIDFDDRMIAILGARGVGKTTFLLQYRRDLEAAGQKALYLSLDYPFLEGVDLLDLVERFVEEGGRYLLLDEVHRYRDFGSYLKSIYDIYDLRVLFTGSSAASLLAARSDLSRRATLYRMRGFSFREFLELKHGEKFDAYGLDALLGDHVAIAKSFENIDILAEFDEYLRVGYYPFYADKRTAFVQSLMNTINLTVDIDLPSLGLVEQKYTYKLKRLLEVVCESEPFEVNYSKIAAAAEISRAKLYDYMRYLEDGELLLLVEPSAKGIKKLHKPAKIYLHNTNLLDAYCDGPPRGTVRETFFVNQLSTLHGVKIPPKGDFLVDGKYTFEIGGPKKGFAQIADVPESYVAADGILHGRENKIPLWLFGFLY